MRKRVFLASVFMSVSLLSTASFASVSNDQVTSQKIMEADGTSAQDTNSGSGIKTNHIQNGAVTDVKISGPISSSKISSTGLNADTVDGQHASEFLKKYGKVAIVAQSGGDYIDPMVALTQITQWCGTPSQLNPCLLKIMPGVYDVGAQTVQMPEYVDLEGSGETCTTITGIGDPAILGSPLLQIGGGEARFLAVEGTSASGG